MGRTPTPEQLQRINSKFAKTPLKPEQVYVFRTYAADTIPIRRSSWFGEYTITMTERILRDLQKGYAEGCPLLASHNVNRLPFGLTFDSVVEYQYNGEESSPVLYTDQYMVTHTYDDDGNKVPIKTEVGDMKVSDIANGIDAGTLASTSIGFEITRPICTICGHDIRKEQCSHWPGRYYEMDDGTPKRCDILAEAGEAIEQSIVYSPAVAKAKIQQGFSQLTGEHSDRGGTEEKTVYSIDDIKKVPLDEPVVCHYSKNGGVELFTRSPRRIERKEENLSNVKEMNSMSDTNVEFKDIQLAFAKAGINFDKIGDIQAAVSAALAAESEKATEALNKQLEAKGAELARVSAELDRLKTDFSDAQSKIMELTSQNEELSKKAELAEQYRKDLIEATIEAGIRAFGNAFNKERQEKYLSTLSIEELKEEKAAYEGQFQERFAGARTTKPKQQTRTATNGEFMYRSDFETEQEFRNYVGYEARRLAAEKGTNVADETEALFRKLSQERV